MRLRNGITVGLLLICAVLAVMEWRYFHAARAPKPAQGPQVSVGIGMQYALLPASEVESYGAGGTKGKVQSWEPTVGDIEGLEANLPQISTLNAGDSEPGRHVANPQNYLRQYLAVEQDGKPRIFVNAFCSAALKGADSDWRKHLLVVMDGGDCYWHAMYDPGTQKFSDLVINGRA